MSELEAVQELNLTPESKAVFGRKAIAFDTLVKELKAITTAISEMEADKHKLSDKIMNLLADHDTKTIMSQGRRVTLVQGSHSTIDRIKLIENGVAPSVILASTKTTDYAFVKITERKS